MAGQIIDFKPKKEIVMKVTKEVIYSHSDTFSSEVYTRIRVFDGWMVTHRYSFDSTVSESSIFVPDRKDEWSKPNN